MVVALVRDNSRGNNTVDSDPAPLDPGQAQKGRRNYAIAETFLTPPSSRAAIA